MSENIIDMLDKAVADLERHPYEPERVMVSAETIVPVAEHLYGKDSPQVIEAEQVRAEFYRARMTTAPRQARTKGEG